MTDEELVDDAEAIGELEYVGIVDHIAQSNVYRYHFGAAQEHKIPVGRESYDPRTRKSAGRVVRLDTVHGTIDLKRGKHSKTPHPRSLIPCPPMDNETQRSAVERVALWVADNGIEGPGPYRAARDLVLAAAPRLRVGKSGGSVRQDGESTLSAARRTVAVLDASCLPIQGPPGSGKTYTAARVIVDLVRAGKRVGVCGPSHRAIGNLLDAMMEHAASERVPVRALQKAAEDEKCFWPGVENTEEEFPRRRGAGKWLR